jgi:hypothetical protein
MNVLVDVLYVSKSGGGLAQMFSGFQNGFS